MSKTVEFTYSRRLLQDMQVWCHNHLGKIMKYRLSTRVKLKDNLIDTAYWVILVDIGDEADMSLFLLQFGDHCE